MLSASGGHVYAGLDIMYLFSKLPVARMLINNIPASHEGLLLLTWFNFNPSMDK